jgi:hypothetical protein
MTSDPEMYSADTYVALDPDSVLMGRLDAKKRWRTTASSRKDAVQSRDPKPLLGNGFPPSRLTLAASAETNLGRRAGQGAPFL